MITPGGRRVRTAGLSWLSVHPAHRRRGLMTTMMHDHFTRCLERGEAVSALYAMEAEIYSRFGYGMASQTVKASIPRGSRMWPVAGADALTVRLERADFDAHDRLVADLQAKAHPPGDHPEPGGFGAQRALHRPCRQPPRLREVAHRHRGGRGRARRVRVLPSQAGLRASAFTTASARCASTAP
ncbi:GNAT family N-acetyltransferase [Demequina litorisediminis]|uniref:N-acetyltransferase domain-containing protein n=1 Tax=Demequina litorisediminis TaxID=1849022 RepID=A0ABQ6IJE7_9MICO|nr:GNAT family N-acetyltransferase [Demequina litorisediminis]GMA36824.1 hypothetical protein GCM10025876_30280 [Demequina litorisediminis]